MIKTRITDKFGIKYPIISAPMGPFYTTELAIAVSEAGGLGVISHTTLMGKNSIIDFKDQIDAVIENTDKPFGFNIRVARLQSDHRILLRKIGQWRKEDPRIREQMIYGLTSAGGPRVAAKIWQKSCPDMYHFHVAPALWLADKCVATGVDGLVITGGEGGGHQSYEKVTTLVLLQQLNKAFPDLPKIACGGFATGEGLAAALSLGAGAIAMGSRFIASKQLEFNEAYKGLIPPGTPQDTGLFTGSFGPIRLYRNKYALEHPAPSTKEEMIAYEKSITLEMMKKDSDAYERIYNGDTENGAVLLGQSIGIIKSIDDVNDIIERVIREAEIAIRSNSAMLK